MSPSPGHQTVRACKLHLARQAGCLQRPSSDVVQCLMPQHVCRDLDHACDGPVPSTAAVKRLYVKQWHPSVSLMPLPDITH